MCQSKFYNVLIGVSIIIVFVYRFLFIKRTPYMINENVSWRTIIFVLVNIVVTLFILKNIWNTLKKKENNSWIKNFTASLMEKYYIKPLKHVAELLLQKRIIKNYVEMYGDMLEKTMKRTQDIYFALFIKNLMPRLILLWALISDIFLFNSIRNFYECMGFLLVLLEFKVMVSLINIHTTNKKNDLEKTDIKVELNINGKTKLTTKKSMTLQELYLCRTKWTYYMNVLDITDAISLSQKNPVYLWVCFTMMLLFIFCWCTYIKRIFFQQSFVNNDVSNFLLWLIRIMLGF